MFDHIGLFTRCSPSACTPFPSTRFCSSLPSHQPPRSYSYTTHHQTRGTTTTTTTTAAAPSTFCTKWRSAGALLNISAIFTLVAAITTLFIVLSKHNSHGRRHGWKVLAGVMGLAGVLEIGAVGIVAEVRDYEQMFQIPEYELGDGWWMGLGGGLMGVVLALGVGVMALMGWIEEEREVDDRDRGR
ncbi:hypothetical protein QBC40DRAFT_262628 [Triangularia verruculosa]|uniref:Uncharacterized protein n=1 Tax=Triangularia verruculosa TaxID=2587418 RepID=A0AAN6XPC7_9PEZI|nr:hypothetical protein QBC40DRAFT_262628 [Triangularia verruculosa]